MAPVNAPLFVTEEFALQHARWYGSAVELHERLLAAVAKIMQSARNELFTTAGFALDQHRGVSGGHGLQAACGRRIEAIASDLLEVKFIADLILQVKLLLGQLLSDLRDLLIGECVVDGNGRQPAI